jgi:hypothetical protein
VRVLFYGGCHAEALRRLFARYVRGLEDVRALTNYRLIRGGHPVPYDAMRGFDWVIFSPILNKEQYNTSHLEADLGAHGVRLLRFPWLQWNGYFPGLDQKGPPWLSGWWYSALETLAAESPTFEHFAEQVFDGTALGEAALRELETTTSWLRRLEAGTDVPVSGYVLDNFRRERLFLTPNHPSTALYRHVVLQIAAALGLQVDPSIHHTRLEAQEGLQVPILPSVARALDLRFQAGDFEHKYALGGEILPLSAFLRLHYSKADIRVAEARTNTRIGRDLGTAEGEALTVKRGERLLLRAVPEANVPRYRGYEVLAVISARQKIAALRGQVVRIFHPHWTLSLSQRVVDPDDVPAAAEQQLAA